MKHLQYMKNTATALSQFTITQPSCVCKHQQEPATYRRHPDTYHRYSRYWFCPGVPTFVAILAVVGLMVLKPCL